MNRRSSQTYSVPTRASEIKAIKRVPGKYRQKSKPHSTLMSKAGIAKRTHKITTGCVETTRNVGKYPKDLKSYKNRKKSRKSQGKGGGP